jgi:hypothetical protein
MAVGESTLSSLGAALDMGRLLGLAMAGKNDSPSCSTFSGKFPSTTRPDKAQRAPALPWTAAQSHDSQSQGGVRMASMYVYYLMFLSAK